ncbi:metallophosphoesterase [Rhizobium sp. 18065]|uniref:metallophosphoesterase family protein n=1 Tax=Rhizobium sp. 18065 TaxID=2681411 RepID=UPI00135B2247|nr:metallophosphoesterase [Rhizobium sp. 18065]
MPRLGPEIPAVAIIADAHFHDIEGNYDVDGVTVGGRRLTVRSWADTARSTRVFNESFAALPAALEDVCSRGIRHVVLLGDYTDDGQRITTESVARLLRHWRDRHNVSFYAIPGNHDVFGPLGKHQSTRYLNASGGTTLVSSDAEIAALDPGQPVVTPRMYCDGMPAGLLPMAEFGLTRNAAYRHWETPFGISDDFELRQHDLHSADGLTTHRLVDASYLVEPVEGLWLLMLDANVFEPRNGNRDIARKKAFLDSSNAGWNALLRVKPHLIDWIADVFARADKLGKRLLAFSHYPVLDPFEDTSNSEEALFGMTDIARRTPVKAVAETLVRAGLKLHFSGHLHVAARSDWAIGSQGLTNIAVPSLVAFPAGYTIVRADRDTPEIETISLASLPLDPDLLDLYRAETSKPGATPEPALEARNYGEFLNRHMHALVVSRYLPNDWPEELRELALHASLADLCRLLLGKPLQIEPPREAQNATTDNESRYTILDDWAKAHDLDPASLNASPLLQLVVDWYRLRQGSDQALTWVPAERLRVYRVLAWEFGDLSLSEHKNLQDFLAIFLGVLGRSIERATRIAPMPRSTDQR